jgi:hypothetical protein
VVWKEDILMNIPAMSDPRTDAEIRADADKAKGLESGTVLGPDGQPRNMRYFPPAPVETYAQYVKRVEGLVDFKPLTEEQWRSETHQLSAKEEMLADLGIISEPAKELDIADYLNLSTSFLTEEELSELRNNPKEIGYPAMFGGEPPLDHLPEGSH